MELLKIAPPDIYKEIENLLKKKGIDCMQSQFAANPELTSILEDDNVLINIGGNAINYARLNIPTLNDVYKDESFKYVFVTKAQIENKEKMIDEVRGLLKEIFNTVRQN